MTTAYWIMDSYGQFGATDLAYVASTRLGWTPTLDAQGGTGYASGTEGVSWYKDRVAVAIAAAPDVFVVVGSVNDRTKVGATVSAAAVSALSALVATGRPVYAVLFAGTGGSPSTNTAAMASTVAAVEAGVSGATLIDGTGWTTGSGTEAVPMGDGNGDRYVQADGVHPNAAGHAYLGIRLAYVIEYPVAVSYVSGSGVVIQTEAGVPLHIEATA